MLTGPPSAVPVPGSVTPLVSSWKSSAHRGQSGTPAVPLLPTSPNCSLQARGAPPSGHLCHSAPPLSCRFRSPHAAWKMMRFSWAPRRGPAPPKRIPSATAAWRSFTNCWRRWAGEACRAWRLETPALPLPPPPPPLLCYEEGGKQAKGRLWPTKAVGRLLGLVPHLARPASGSPAARTGEAPPWSA